MPQNDSSHKTNTPATNPLLQSLVYFVSIAEPVATLPQVYEIWISRQTQGVSLLSWCGYLFAGIIWLTYGFSRKDKALTISSLAWVVTEGMVIVGLLIFK